MERLLCSDGLVARNTASWFDESGEEDNKDPYIEPMVQAGFNVGILGNCQACAYVREDSNRIHPMNACPFFPGFRRCEEDECEDRGAADNKFHTEPPAVVLRDVALACCR